MDEREAGGDGVGADRAHVVQSLARESLKAGRPGAGRPKPQSRNFPLGAVEESTIFLFP